MSTFLEDLEEIINKNNIESESNTPDFILVKYIKDCLDAFTKASRDREKWYGKSLSINGIKDHDEINLNDKSIQNDLEASKVNY